MLASSFNSQLWLRSFFLACLLHDQVGLFAHSDGLAVREYLSSTDLPAFGTNVANVRNVFARRFGQKPGHLSLNDEVYYGHFGPPKKDKKSHRCFKKISKPKIEIAQSTNKTLVVGSSVVKNQGSTPVTHSVSISGSWSEGFRHTTTNTLGVDFTKSLSVYGVFSLDWTVSISTAAEDEKSVEEIKDYTTIDSVSVPPHSQVTVSMHATTQTQTAHYTADVWVHGWFGGSHRGKYRWLRGHHHTWNFLREYEVLPKVKGKLKGRLEAFKVIHVETVVDPPEKISSSAI